MSESLDKKKRERDKQLKRQEKLERRLARNDEKRQSKSEPDADDTPPRDSGHSGGERGTDGERSEDGG